MYKVKNKLETLVGLLPPSVSVHMSEVIHVPSCVLAIPYWFCFGPNYHYAHHFVQVPSRVGSISGATMMMIIILCSPHSVLSRPLLSAEEHDERIALASERARHAVHER